MKKVLLIVGVIVVVIFLATLIVSKCVDQTPAENEIEGPNMTLAQRQRLLEEKYEMLLRVVDQLQRDNAQLRRDLDALSRE